MLITEKIGNLSCYNTGLRSIDFVLLKWFECRKRILVKTTQAGAEIAIKFLNENPELTEGDVLYADEETLIAVAIEPCDCIVISPKNNLQMAAACYEIGNKHLPLFFQDDCLLVPFEQPLFQLLQAQGYTVGRANHQLLNPLKTTVAPHNIGLSASVLSSI